MSEVKYNPPLETDGTNRVIPQRRTSADIGLPPNTTIVKNADNKKVVDLSKTT